MQEAITEAIILLQRAKMDNCTCLTKTPEVKFHKDYCKYKRLSLAVNRLEEILKKDNGPWEVSSDGRTISSDDFTHDVMLRVTGDFADDNQRKIYSDNLARRLNRKDVEDGS